MADVVGWEARMAARRELARELAADLGQRPSAEARDCGDCGVHAGDPHRSGCDLARCMAYGSQRLQCQPGARMVVRGYLPNGGVDVDWVVDGHDCGEDIWTGLWPGKAECREYGWWAVFDPPWRRVPAGTPGAVEDLNRLVVEARWDRETQRWVRG